MWHWLFVPDSPRLHICRFLNIRTITLALALLLRLVESGFDIPCVRWGVACLMEDAALGRVVAAKAAVESGVAM